MTSEGVDYLGLDTLLTDAESVWFTERTAARQLVQRAHQLSTEALR